MLIDLDMLKEEGWLTDAQAEPPEWIHSSGYVDFGSVVWWKIPVLKTAAAQFLDVATEKKRVEYEAFKNDNAAWLDNYSIFMSIKEHYDAKAQKENKFGAMWSNYWPHELAVHEPKAVSDWHASHVREAEIHKAIQFFFFTQWSRLKKYANEHGVRLVGVIRIFVAADSADVWADQ